MFTQPQNPRSILPADGLANTSLPQQVPNKLCEYCDINRRTTRASGILSRYCDTECAKLARARMPARVNQYRENFAPEEGNLCAVCKECPRLDDGIEVYDFCSRACADVALKSQRPVALQTGRVYEDSGELIRTLIEKIPLRKTSVLPGCILSPNNNEVGGYCTKGRLEQANAPLATGSECLRCKKRRAVKFGFCSETCITKVQDSAPCILPVPEGHVVFKNVQEQFASSWRHPVPEIPVVRFVYKVISTKAITDRYESYKRVVERRRNFKAQNYQPGNERRRWHGTKRACNVGDMGTTDCCNSPNCALCSILQNSFSLVHIKNNRTWKRFGMGFYTTSTSSKANDYSKNMTTSRYKAILLNRVVVGRGCKLKGTTPKQDEALTEPPHGYDSVLGEKGEKLNYDELIVYRQDALLPSYLIIYDNTSHSTLQK